MKREPRRGGFRAPSSGHKQKLLWSQQSENYLARRKFGYSVHRLRDLQQVERWEQFKLFGHIHVDDEGEVGHPFNR